MAFDPSTAIPDAPDKTSKFDPSTASPTPINSGPAVELSLGQKAKIIAGLIRDNPLTPNPETAKSVALNAGGAMGGASLGAILAPETLGLSIPIGAVVGGMLGNTADQLTRPGQTGIKKGELLASGITSYVPGAAVVGAGGMALAREATKAGARGLLAKGAESVIDEGRLPTLGEAAIATALPAAGGALAQRMNSSTPEAAKAVKDAIKLDSPLKRETLELAKEAGYVVPPADVNPSMANNRLQSFGGKAATSQEAKLKNQVVTDRLAKKAAGVPDDAPLNPSTLEDARQPFYDTYQKVADLSKDAAAIDAVRLVNPDAADLMKSSAANLEAFKRAKSAANGYYRTINQPNQYDYDKLVKAMDFDRQATELENSIEQAAKFSGKPELIEEFKNARIGLARNHAVEQNFNPADDHVLAAPFGVAFKKQQPLSGGLETIGRFAAAFPNQVGNAARSTAAGVSALEASSIGGLGLGGMLASGNPAGAALGLIPLARGPVRKAILSDFYQNLSANIPAKEVKVDPRIMATLLQEASQASGQKLGRKN